MCVVAVVVFVHIFDVAVTVFSFFFTGINFINLCLCGIWVLFCALKGFSHLNIIILTSVSLVVLWLCFLHLHLWYTRNLFNDTEWRVCVDSFPNNTLIISTLIWNATLHSIQIPEYLCCLLCTKNSILLLFSSIYPINTYVPGTF